MYKIENLVFGSGKGDREIRDEIQILRKDEQDTFTSDHIPKRAQWDEVINLCEKYLKESKDLYILNRMCEAISALYGIPGFKLSLDIIQKFLEDPKDYFPLEEEIRKSYFQWINNKLYKCLYKNLNIEKILQGKQEVETEEIEMLYECIEKAKDFFFYLESFELGVLGLISDLQKN